jgi:hypothetical protein
MNKDAGMNRLNNFDGNSLNDSIEKQDKFN